MSRPQHDWRSGSRETYKAFCEAHPHIKISFKEWSAILKTYNSLLLEEILETGDKLKLPYGFGALSITKKKNKRETTVTRNGVEEKIIILPVDWKRSKEEGKRIYHLNHHTNGYRYSWIWFAKEAMMRCNNIWTFNICRKYSRMLPIYLRKPDSQYQYIYKQWVRIK